MPWPQPTDYNAAVQAPSSFADDELRQSSASIDPILGLPRLHSGNFADVYQLIGGDDKSWAIKCFTRETPNLVHRYRKICAHLRHVDRPFLVDFSFLEQGIRIRDGWYPILKMKWVEGLMLNQFLDQSADRKSVVTRLAYLWQKLARELRDAKIGHGDLQHSNILLVPGNQGGGTLSLHVIDYDGLWIPDLSDVPSGERGHPNYQHPTRLNEGGYGPEIDRFSMLCVYTALRAIGTSGKSLWRRYDNGENLLFREIDFAEPDKSEVMRELAEHPDDAVRTLVGHLVLALRRPPELTPRLDQILDQEEVRPLDGVESAEVRAALHLEPARRPRARVLVGVATETLSGEDPTDEQEPVGGFDAQASPRIAPVAMTKKPSERRSSPVPALTPDQRRAAAGQFERANQVVVTGNYDYGIQLLLSCTKLDPTNLMYRQALRRTAKAKYKNNMRGHWLAWLTTLRSRLRLRRAMSGKKYLKALEHGELILQRAPWDVPAQMVMSEAAEALEQIDLAVWFLEQARQKNPRDPKLNRALAILYERRGNFNQAIALWQLVHEATPTDSEAWQKVKDLAVSDTIARGNYQGAIDHADQRFSTTGGPKTPAGESKAAETPSSLRANRIARESAPLLQKQKADPTNHLTYIQLAALYRKAGQIEDARRILVEGLGPTSNAFELCCELADLDIETFRHDLDHANEKLKALPTDAALLQVRDRLAKEIDSRELDLFRQKADRYPGERGHRLEIGIRLSRLGQIDEAIKELQAVRDDARYSGRAYQHLGQCFLARNNLSLAQRNFDEALRLLPPQENETRKELLYLMAQLAARAGDLRKAIERAQDLAHLDFSYRDISQLLEEWQGNVSH